MGIHTLRQSQIVPVPTAACWAFFSDPRNLAKITPPSLDFQVLAELPTQIHAGLLIEYRVRPLFGVPLTWLTEITQVEAGRRFVDEQRVGPYRLWHHEHTFEPLEDGTTMMRDLIHYVPPFGLLGELVEPLLIAPQLAKILLYRKTAVERLFPLSA